jgi:hypothetical protein
MQLVFPDDEAVQPHLKLLAMATRWKKAQDEISTSINNTNDENNPTTTIEDNVPLPESRVDDEEMNDES